MKRITITILLLHACMWLYGQFKLHGQLSNRSEGQQAVVNNPFVYGYFDDVNIPLTTDEDGNFSGVIPLNEEKIGYLRWGDHETLLWMRPGTDLAVGLDGSDGRITFGGAMAAANQLLHELELQKAPQFFTDSNRVTANEMRDQVIQPHMKQLAANIAKVDASSLMPSQKDFLKAELHYHFVVYVDFYVRTARWPRDVWSNFIIEFMQKETPQPKSTLRGPMYYSFIDAYVGFLASRAFSHRNNPTKFAESLDSIYGVSSFDSLMAVAREHGETSINWLAVKRAFDASTTERYLAKHVKEKYGSGEVSTGNYLLQALEMHNPNSNYLDSLISIQTRLLEKMTAANHDIIIPDDYRTFQHIKPIVKQFRGKVVYLDIWGTWCGPCKEEMQHLPSIKQPIEGKDIIFLYLAMDDDHHDKKWREYIHANAITGVHLRKNNADIQAIWNELLTNDRSRHGRYPTYFIFDKQGNLVANDVKRPSDGNELVQQLERYLNP